SQSRCQGRIMWKERGSKGIPRCSAFCSHPRVCSRGSLRYAFRALGENRVPPPGGCTVARRAAFLTLLLLASAARASLAAAAPAEDPRQLFRHGIPLEQEQDPLVPLGAQPVLRAASIITFGPYVSRQANVNALGNDIVGDAANEPSLAVDPTNHNRM